MPLKWKIYHACALYLLLWAIGFSLYAFYQLMQNGSAEVEIAVFMFMLLFATIGKATLSIKAIIHYRQTTLPPKIERRFFIAAYCFIILMALLFLWLSIFIIIPEEFRQHTDGGYLPGLQSLVLDLGVFGATIASVYFSIADLVLLKAIRLKQHENLLSFEIEQP